MCFSKYYQLMDFKLFLQLNLSFEMANQSNPLSRLMDRNILNGPNFSDWLRNLKLVLNMEKIAYCLDKSPPVALPDGSSEEERNTWREWHEHDFRARNYILASMNNDL